MRIYQINPIGGGSGFKVHVADQSGGLRVVGIFFTQSDAQAWIATDQRHFVTTGTDMALEPASQA
jgi:hypothetical protein